MNMMSWKYILMALLLVVAELLYFRVAERFDIVDRPNGRSSHTKVVIRGGGIIFVVGVWLWSVFYGFRYPWLLAGVTLAAGVSFADDVRSLRDSVRLVAQFAAMGLLFVQLVRDNGALEMSWWGWALTGASALVVCVGATNIYNFMDGINGITAGYSLSVLVPLLLVNGSSGRGGAFAEGGLMVTALLSVLVFGIFNFRAKNRAKCFAGDVGSVGMAFILLYLTGSLVLKTRDVTWLVFLSVYGVDGVCTIVHRILLHENLGEAHRKHAYQLMANELGLSHVTVSLLYMVLQLSVSLGMVYLVPDTVAAHWLYLVASVVVLTLAYVLFMKRYYHLHEAYLETMKTKAE